MFDWASFLAGVLGAAVGGGITLLVALLVRHDQRRTLLRPLARQITAKLQKLIDVRSREGVINGSYGPRTSRAMLNASRAIAELSMHSGRAGKRVGMWIDRKMFQMLHTDNDMVRVNALLHVSEALADWVGGTRRSRRFARAVAKIDNDPDDIANHPPSSAWARASLEP